jgi:hypothetical protein
MAFIKSAPFWTSSLRVQDVNGKISVCCQFCVNISEYKFEMKYEFLEGLDNNSKTNHSV